MKRVEVIEGKIVRLANHTPPVKAIVAFCPHCITYGSPMGRDDRVCGNCGKKDLRIYEEVIKEAKEE